MTQNIIPPNAVEVWGPTISELKLIKRVKSVLTTKNEGEKEDKIQVSFSPSTYRYFRVVAFPMDKMPKWH